MRSAGVRESLLRAVLPLAVLTALDTAPGHGYALVARLRAAGFTNAQGGTVYPLLRGLEREGLVESTWDVGGPGPARKVFRVTEGGRRRAEDDRRGTDEVLAGLAELAQSGSPEQSGRGSG